MHHTIKVLLYFFDVFFCAHETLHENVELLIKPDNFNAGINYTGT